MPHRIRENRAKAVRLANCPRGRTTTARRFRVLHTACARCRSRTSHSVPMGRGLKTRRLSRVALRSGANDLGVLAAATWWLRTHRRRGRRQERASLSISHRIAADTKEHVLTTCEPIHGHRRTHQLVAYLRFAACEGRTTGYRASRGRRKCWYDRRGNVGRSGHACHADAGRR